MTKTTTLCKQRLPALRIFESFALIMSSEYSCFQRFAYVDFIQIIIYYITLTAEYQALSIVPAHMSVVPAHFVRSIVRGDPFSHLDSVVMSLIYFCMVPELRSSAFSQLSKQAMLSIDIILIQNLSFRKSGETRKPPPTAHYSIPTNL